MVESVKGMLVVFVVCVVWYLLWWVLSFVRLIGVRVIGRCNFCLNSLVVRLSVEMLCSMCWCRVMFFRFVMFC